MLAKIDRGFKMALLCLHNFVAKKGFAWPFKEGQFKVTELHRPAGAEPGAPVSAY